MTEAILNTKPKLAPKTPAKRAKAPSRETLVQPGPMADMIGPMLRMAQLAVFQDFGRTLVEYGLRPTHYAALTLIESNPGLKQTQLGEALRITRTNFVAVLDALEEKGLAARRPIKSDRRSYAIELTKKGATTMATLHELSRNHEARIIERIGEKGHKQLLKLLREMASLNDVEAVDDDI